MTDEIIASDKQPPKRRINWGNVGILFSTLGIIIVIAAFGFGYYRLACVNISLAKMIGQLQHRETLNQTELTAVKQSIVDLQQSAQKSQALSQQQEQLVAEWRAAQKGNLEKWYVAEAACLVRLANDQARFSQNIPMAITLLQRADQILQNGQTADLLALRKSIAEDLVRLQALPQLDLTGLYARLMALDGQLDQLPLPFNPLKTESTQPSPSPISKDLPWWKAGLEHSWQTLRQIVTVRNIDATQPPLVLPEQKFFLYQNLHTQLQTAIWGALHRNAAVYQLSLAQLIKWIPQYFDQNAAQTKSVLENVSELIKMNVQAPIVNFADTIQLFDQYFAQPPSSSIQ